MRYLLDNPMKNLIRPTLIKVRPRKAFTKKKYIQLLITPELKKIIYSGVYYIKQD